MDSTLRSIIEKAAYLWGAVALVAYTGLVVMVDDWMEPQRAPATPDTVTQQREATWGDMVDATMPDQVTTYEAPDTSDTQTECFQMPLWMVDTRRSGTATGSTTTAGPIPNAGDTSRVSDTSAALSRTETSLPNLSAGPTYAITPLMNGSPSLSVGSNQVVLSGVLPTGEGRTWTYDVPTERNRVGLWGRASTLPGMTVAASGLAYRRDADWGELEVSAGYAVTPEGRGGVVSVSVSTGYEW